MEFEKTLMNQRFEISFTTIDDLQVAIWNGGASTLHRFEDIFPITQLTQII